MERNIGLIVAAAADLYARKRMNTEEIGKLNRYNAAQDLKAHNPPPEAESYIERWTKEGEMALEKYNRLVMEGKRTITSRYN